MVGFRQSPETLLTILQVRVIAGEHVRPFHGPEPPLDMLQGITLEPDFGFAPSTLVYQGQ